MAINGQEFSVEFEILMQRVSRLERIMTEELGMELPLLPSQLAAMQEAEQRNQHRESS